MSTIIDKKTEIRGKMNQCEKDSPEYFYYEELLKELTKLQGDTQPKMVIHKDPNADICESCQ